MGGGVGGGVCVRASVPRGFLRGGGGGGWSGGGGAGGGGGGGAGALIYLLIRFLLWLTIEHPVIVIPVDIIVIGLVIYWFARPTRQSISLATSPMVSAPDPVAGAVQQDFQREFNQLRRFDPNFSEIIFTDFCYALYGRAHDARGHGQKDLDLLSPYLREEARANLWQMNPSGLKAVEGIIVGAMQVTDVRGLATPVVFVTIDFDANYTEVTDREISYYVRERWVLERKRDVLSPTPEQATALHCPRCGAALQKNTVGACAFCGTKVENGEFQWYVRSITT